MYILKKHAKKILFIFLILLTLIVLTISVLIKRINNRIEQVIEYNSKLQYHAEQHDDYYIVAKGANIFQLTAEGGIQIFDVYYNTEHRKITISLDVWMDLFGECKYKISFCDDNDDDFGGYAFVDQNMNLVPENDYDSLENTEVDIQVLMNSNSEYIEKLVNIANERWNLELKYIPSNKLESLRDNN